MSQAVPQHAGVTFTPLPGGRLAPVVDSGWRPDHQPARLPSFVGGPENRLLVAVMNQLVAQLSAKDCTAAEPPVASPLVLVGPHGSGKSHLARGIVELWQAKRGVESAQFLTAADFGREFSDAIHRQAHHQPEEASSEGDPGEASSEKQDDVRNWRRALRRKQLVVIDDVHRLGSLHRQTELRNTLDAITGRGGLLLLTATGPLAETTSFDRPLLSRLTSGLTLEIAPPGREARQELLQQAAKAVGCQLNHDALHTLAEGLPPEPPRVLRAAIELRRRAGTRIDVRAAERLLADDKPQNSPPVGDILRVVARYHKLPLKVLISASRRQSVVAARSVAIYLSRELTPLSYAQIGQAIGGRDHTTIMHNYRRVEKQLPKDRALRSAIDELRRLLSPV